MWIQFSLIATLGRDEESRETLEEERMGMPIDCTIHAMRSAEARPVLKIAVIRLKADEEVGSSALKSFISREADAVTAQDWIRMARGRGRKTLGCETMGSRSTSC